MSPCARGGILIAFEGIDGAGKSTQARLLRDRLLAAGLDVVSTKEPTAGPHGQRLRESGRSGRLSPQEELEAFLADRREHVREVIAPALAAGKVVIVDRYYYSSAAYQGARGIDRRQILTRNEAFAPLPDLAVLLDVRVRTGLSRIAQRGAGTNLFEREADLQRVAEVFLSLGGGPLRRFDGERDALAIHEEIVRAVDPLLRAQRGISISGAQKEA
jgi:dTMP kinase